MSHRYSFAPLAALVLLAAVPSVAQAQTGSVGIGTTNPAASAALEVRSTTQGLLLPRLTLAQRNALTASTTAPPVPGLIIYQTDSTPGLYAYDGTAWVRLGNDNLGNHSATQTLNLNDQRLLGSLGTSLGDSTAQVELNASVGTQSAALITRSNFGARYSRVILSGYGKLPDGTSTANDFGIWATGYRGGSWAGFFSAAGYGANREPLRWVGICQNPGYNGTGSAIRIVDGTQGAGKVLMSDASGYGTWQPVSATTAGGNFNLGTYYLVGNGGSTGLAITNAGRLGINTTTPYSQLANTATNILGSEGTGGNPGSLAWAANQSGYAGMFYNANTAANATGLAVKIAATGTTAAFDVSQGTTQDAAGTTLLRVQGNGNVGIGVATANYKLDVNGQIRANNVAVTSDQRFKTDIQPLRSALASVLALRGVRYEWNALGIRHGGMAGAKQVGLLAQEVEKIYPELVSTDAEGYKAVNYAQLTPVLIEALKEQQAQIAALQARAATAEAAATQATSAASSAQAQAARATATLETLEARLRRLEAGISAQAQR
ncbi:tail fiber domain-containing protein [Hymenobacter endophyticus]|uniref:Tail fiber domain-containing protein n=1 Tax=Hymenobacter endophyticus TaxID=3076335 RepID=A0ABU3TJE8_9BACT|nr:tail fiber domain-containing protein [Hymenobacter endophyticus]MDU0371486.1 tail fiber domain-containing protein [Hymenobacter endophyticus]